MYVRLGDLDIVGCHRQSYDGYSLGKFVVENDKIVDIEAKNIEMAIAMLTFDLGTQPYCESCILKDVCSGGCMGSQLEVNGDSFIPIPIICDLLHHKHYTLINKYINLGIYQYMKPRLSIEAIIANETLYNMVKERRTTQMSAMLEVLNKKEEVLKHLNNPRVRALVHPGFKKYVSEVLELIYDDIEEVSILEDNSKHENPKLGEITQRVNAILNDLKNIAILNPVTEDFHNFVKDLTVYLSNWNNIYNNAGVSNNILALSRLSEGSC